MKVLQINSVCGVGSTGRIAADIHQILLKNGYESYIAYGREEALNCDNVIKIGTKLDNYMHFFVTRILDRHGFGSKRTTLDFVEKMEKLKPDIIHLHNIHGYYLNIEILFDYLKRANKPVIWTLHDCWSFTGHCSHFDFVNCIKWKKECHNCPEKKEYPASEILDQSQKNFNDKRLIFTEIKNLTIVTPSNWLADLVKESFLKDYPVQVINNGIDLGLFNPIKSNFRKEYGIIDKFIILGVANSWTERKGLNYFLELSKKMQSDEIIVLVGLTEKQKKILPSNIIGISRTSSIQALAEIYTSADVFVNPTLEEVMGLTNVEALACGTPVITFKTGGSVECVDEDTGIIVEKGNLNELLEAISNIKSKVIVFEKEKLVNRAKFLYNKDEKFLEYLSLYNRLNEENV